MKRILTLAVLYAIVVWNTTAAPTPLPREARGPLDAVQNPSYDNPDDLPPSYEQAVTQPLQAPIPQAEPNQDPLAQDELLENEVPPPSYEDSQEEYLNDPIFFEPQNNESLQVQSPQNQQPTAQRLSGQQFGKPGKKPRRPIWGPLPPDSQLPLDRQAQPNQGPLAQDELLENAKPPSYEDSQKEYLNDPPPLYKLQLPKRQFGKPPGFRPFPPSFRPLPPGLRSLPPGFRPLPPGFIPLPPGFKPLQPGFRPLPPRRQSYPNEFPKTKPPKPTKSDDADPVSGPPPMICMCGEVHLGNFEHALKQGINALAGGLQAVGEALSNMSEPPKYSKRGRIRPNSNGNGVFPNGLFPNSVFG